MTGGGVPPHGRVFLSHASEDKARFVMAFATALRMKGIDVWLDKWEMLPGDSLVDKIFEEGLKEAAAVIVVVSKYSIGKPWVREELNAATVKKITTGTKLIPVVIDECEVPECLKTTIWERIQNLDDFEDPLHRIVASILGLSVKPALGTPPRAYTTDPSKFPGLTSTDVFLLRAMCDYHIAHNVPLIAPDELWADHDQNRLPPSRHTESQEHLSRMGFIKLHRSNGDGPYFAFLEPSGLEAYLRASKADYVRKTREIGLCLINTEAKDSHSLAETTNLPVAVINHILQRYQGQGHIRVHEANDGSSFVWDISPTLRRAVL